MPTITTLEPVSNYFIFYSSQ